MSAYLVIAYDVADADAYAGYVPERLPVIRETLERHGGRLLSGGADARWLGGESRERIVIMEFPSVDAAQSWQDDPGYAEAKAIRLGATTRRIEFIVGGLSGA
ncbi:MAG: DUF1330 domain-containing protein [Myxococcota bacterium]